MTEETQGAAAGPKGATIRPEADTDVERDARQLALVDRVIGLEAENANLRMQLAQAEHRAGGDLRASATWRAGNVVLTPVRLIRRIARGRGR